MGLGWEATINSRPERKKATTMNKPIKFFKLTTDLRGLLLTIKQSDLDYPHKSLVDFTLSSGHYHPKDRVWLNKVREYYIQHNHNFDEKE